MTKYLQQYFSYMQESASTRSALFISRQVADRKKECAKGKMCQLELGAFRSVQREVQAGSKRKEEYINKL